MDLALGHDSDREADTVLMLAEGGVVGSAGMQATGSQLKEMFFLRLNSIL